MITAILLCALPLAISVAALSKDGRIINGLPAAPGQFPHQVGLNITYPNSTAWCGGNLISDQWVLTAAHCLYNSTSATATLGSTDRFIAKKIFNLTTANMTVHPQYDPVSLKNDVALFTIPPVNFTNEISPITLATDTSKSYVNTSAVIAGWGLTSTFSNEKSPVLNYAHVVVADFKNFHLVGNISHSVSSNICILTPAGANACKFDSGGPLLTRLPNGKNILIGVTSFGSYDCHSRFPSCFSRVTYFVPWIEQVTGLKF